MSEGTIILLVKRGLAHSEDEFFEGYFLVAVASMKSELD